MRIEISHTGPRGQVGSIQVFRHNHPGARRQKVRAYDHGGVFWRVGPVWLRKPGRSSGRYWTRSRWDLSGSDDSGTPSSKESIGPRRGARPSGVSRARRGRTPTPRCGSGPRTPSVVDSRGAPAGRPPTQHDVRRTVRGGDLPGPGRRAGRWRGRRSRRRPRCGWGCWRTRRMGRASCDVVPGSAVSAFRRSPWSAVNSGDSYVRVRSTTTRRRSSPATASHTVSSSQRPAASTTSSPAVLPVVLSTDTLPRCPWARWARSRTARVRMVPAPASGRTGGRRTTPDGRRP
jgi:hypothetical protein